MVVTLELVGIVSSAIFVAVGIVMWVHGQFNKRDADIKVAKSEASEKISKFREEFSDYKLHVSETFATKGGVQESFNQVMSSIERLSGRIDKLMALNKRGGDAD